jgi:hypothetical protein
MKKRTSIFRTAVAATVLSLVSIAAHAATIHFKAHLKGSSEVPANSTAGTGALTATLDTSTNELKYHVDFSGLTGDATAAHFHGPAAPGANAGVQVAVKTSPVVSPIEGEATITAEQAKDLVAGKWYFNIHTAANAGGEIRGQVRKTR